MEGKLIKSPNRHWIGDSKTSSILSLWNWNTNMIWHYGISLKRETLSINWVPIYRMAPQLFSNQIWLDFLNLYTLPDILFFRALHRDRAWKQNPAWKDDQYTLKTKKQSSLHSQLNEQDLNDEHGWHEFSPWRITIINIWITKCIGRNGSKPPIEFIHW